MFFWVTCALLPASLEPTTRNVTVLIAGIVGYAAAYFACLTWAGPVGTYGLMALAAVDAALWGPSMVEGMGRAVKSIGDDVVNGMLAGGRSGAPAHDLDDPEDFDSEDAEEDPSPSPEDTGSASASAWSSFRCSAPSPEDRRRPAPPPPRAPHPASDIHPDPHPAPHPASDIHPDPHPASEIQPDPQPDPHPASEIQPDPQPASEIQPDPQPEVMPPAPPARARAPRKRKAPVALETLAALATVPEDSSVA